MSYVSLGAAPRLASLTRPMIMGLFVASCLLSIVSWYTTQQGMALYLATWFAVLASLGVQTALVLVAWLIGFTRKSRVLLVTVYAITAVVSVAFSYVALYTWFSARARPAVVQRQLYDTLSSVAGRAQETLASAIGEGEKHALALEEMTGAEKSHGYISRADDADPYLAGIRQAVAREAQTYSVKYPEGSGEGLRYTAFDRYSKLTRQSVDRMKQAQRGLADLRAQLKPLDSTEGQLRAFRRVYDPVPWTDIEQSLHSGNIERPAIPSYSDFVDVSATGQEDLLLAFQELFTAPTSRHVFALALAAFIDIIVFLLAYASGPYFFGAPEERWVSAGATLDSTHGQVFVRNLLRKCTTGPQAMPRVEASALSSGELQICLLLVAKGLAASMEEDGKQFYLLNPSIHEHLVESLSTESFPLRAESVGAQPFAMGNEGR